MGDYPLTLKVKGRRCVVVGGGAVGVRKADALAGAGAHVVAVAPQIDDRLRAAEVHRRVFQPSDLEGAFLAIAATGSATVNAEVAAAARARGVLVNVADDPDASDFHVPAAVRHGEFTIAVSTGAAGPALARRLREELEDRYGGAYGELCALLAPFRRLVREQVDDPLRRREILQAAGDPELAGQIEREGREATWRRLLDLLEPDGKT